MNMHDCTSSRSAAVRGFTLVELLVAIAVLLVVILATSRIFGTASQVTGLGQANATVLQEVAALERRLREDIANLSDEGFFAIRQVAVPNDIHVANGGALLNPFLADDAVIRADQLVFFTNQMRTPQTADFAGAMNTFAQEANSRVYYGHAVQLPNAVQATVSGDVANAHDPGLISTYQGINTDFRYLFDIYPWMTGPVNMVRTRITRSSNGNVFARQNANPLNSIDGTQPDALSWLLARQAVTLMDDDQQPPDSDSKTSYMGSATGGAGGVRTARSIFIDQPGHGFSREVRNGRVDAAATRLDDIREYVTRQFSSGNRRPWNQPSFGGGVNADQRSIIASSMYYPRGERIAPGVDRVDQALTNHVIGTAVSSFIVEWTWAAGTGEVRDDLGNLVPTGNTNAGLDDFYYGFRPNCWNLDTDNWCQGGNGFEQPEQPWFGLNWPQRGVGFMGFDDAAINDPDNGLHYWERANFRAPQAVAWDFSLDNADNNIERYFGPGHTAPQHPYEQAPGPFDDIRIYEAIFGYNRNTPLDQFGNFNHDLGYTPWPTAIRVTVVFHDTAGRLEHGREFQFVIDLPRRTW